MGRGALCSPLAIAAALVGALLSIKGSFWFALASLGCLALAGLVARRTPVVPTPLDAELQPLGLGVFQPTTASPAALAKARDAWRALRPN